MCAGKKTVTIGLMLTSLAPAFASAESIPVANASFESPTVTLAQVASPFVDAWITDGPVKTDIGIGFLINLNTGIFPNTPEGSEDRLDNVDGNQAAYLGAQTGNEFSQLLTTPFAIGTRYTLTVAVARSFVAPPDSSAALRLALFYVGNDNLRHLVTATDVFNDEATGLSPNHLYDFSTTSEIVIAGDPAVGRPIGVLLVTEGPVGGFFDADNVRVSCDVEPPMPGDFDLDWDVDGGDLATFQSCVSGPAIPRAEHCAQADFDGDNDVDQSDFGFMQRYYTGERVSPGR